MWDVQEVVGGEPVLLGVSLKVGLDDLHEVHVHLQRQEVRLRGTVRVDETPVVKDLVVTVVDSYSPSTFKFLSAVSLLELSPV